MGESRDQAEGIKALICRVGKLSALRADEDMYNAGFTSVSALELLLELESEYGVSIPDDHFIAARTARDLAAMVSRLKQEQAS